MEKCRFIHKETHKTLNCEKCGFNYCVDVDRKSDGGDGTPCEMTCEIPKKNVETKGLCRFCEKL
jgi:hypothetical protein